jgi:hypothetical protein
MHSHLKTIKVLGEVDVSHYVDFFSDIDDADWMGEFAKFSKKNIPFFSELERLPVLYPVLEKDSHKTIEELASGWSVEDIIKFMNYGDYETDVPTKGNLYDKYYDRKFFNDIKGLLSKSLGEGQIMMFVFNLMNPHSKIDPHSDERTGDKKRIHIPVVTHPDITLSNNGDELHMERGKVYMIDHTKEHSVANPTDCERIHIVIDWKLDVDY